MTTGTHDHLSRGDDEQATRSGGIVGVRLRGSSQVTFFSAQDPEIAVGSWVLVTTPEGEQPARIVIAPVQILLSQHEGPLAPILRVLPPDDVSRMEEISPPVARGVDMREGKSPVGARLLGGLGKSGRAMQGSPEAAMSPDLSYENAQYREAKAKGPQLGQRVGTETGDGIVVSLDVFKHLVTVRYDDRAHRETHSWAELVPPR
jgi:hypothetical protein